MPSWADLIFFFLHPPAAATPLLPRAILWLSELTAAQAPPGALAHAKLAGKGRQALPLSAPAQQHEQWSLIAASDLVGTGHRRFLSHKASLSARMITTSYGTDMKV